jgi:hypothetical protein
MKFVHGDEKAKYEGVEGQISVTEIYFVKVSMM